LRLYLSADTDQEGRHNGGKCQADQARYKLVQWAAPPMIPAAIGLLIVALSRRQRGAIVTAPLRAAGRRRRDEA
jgi:hypothetical protein